MTRFVMGPKVTGPYMWSTSKILRDKGLGERRERVYLFAIEKLSESADPKRFVEIFSVGMAVQVFCVTQKGEKGLNPAR